MIIDGLIEHKVLKSMDEIKGVGQESSKVEKYLKKANLSIKEF